MLSGHKTGTSKHETAAMERMTKPEYQLTIRPLPDQSDPAGIRRLRRALKCLLRSFGLQVTDIRETKQQPPQEADE